MAKKLSNSERVREIGSPRIEVVVEDLSPMQIEQVKTTITELLDREDDGKARLKALAKGFKDVLAIVKANLAVARTEVATGKRRTEVEIQEFLTKSNEVIRVRKDTGEQVGARTASADDLQEPIPFEAKDEPEDGDFAA